MSEEKLTGVKCKRVASDISLRERLSPTQTSRSLEVIGGEYERGNVSRIKSL